MSVNDVDKDTNNLGVPFENLQVEPIIMLHQKAFESCNKRDRNMNVKVRAGST